MRKTLCVSTLLVVLSGTASAQPLDGREIVVQGGETGAVGSPISIPYAGPAPDAAVEVVDVEGKDAFPATVRGDALVFIPDAVKAKKKHTYAVKVLDETRAPLVLIEKNAEGDALAVTVNGGHFTTYHSSNENKKPFLWPVYAEGGATITRNWPMGEDKYPVTDHVHHKSIWTSYGDLNGVDCWGEGGNSGFQHTDEVAFGSGDAYGWVHAKNTWQDKDHKPVIAEEREYRFYAGPAGARMFDLAITFTAAYGTVKFGDTKEGGILAYRIRPEIQATYNNKEKKQIMRKGVMSNVNGSGGNVWGKPSPWTDYSGDIEGVGVRGLAAFDHPDNLRHPTTWHFRDYGLNGANCFGLSYFTNKKENGDYTLDEGQSLTFKYRVIIHSGDVNEAHVAERYNDYANPPEAAWAD